MTEVECLAIATPFINDRMGITDRMGDPASVIFGNLKCYRGLECADSLALMSASDGYRFASRVDSNGINSRYTGMTPFSGIARGDGDGPWVVRYCITSGASECRFCIPSLADE